MSRLIDIQRVNCGRMKEIWRQTLTNQAPTPYSIRYGDTFMAEPGQGENSPKRNTFRLTGEGSAVDAATRRLEQVARRGKQNPVETSQTTGAASADVVNREPGPPVGGIIDRTGITSESLLGALDAIDDAAVISPTGNPAEETLVKILEQVSMMQEGNTPEEKEKFSREKILARERIARKTVEIKESNLVEMKANYRAQGLYGERKLTVVEKGQIENARRPEDIEKLFNRMFDRVDSRPRAEFSAAFGSIGTFEHDEFTKTLNEAIAKNKDIGDAPVVTEEWTSTGTERAKELNSILQQFENEYSARSIIHNAYYAVLAGMDTDHVADFIDSFASGFADLAFSKRGVTQAMHFYEQALLITRESAGGYLKPTEVVGEMKTNSEGKVNELARKLLNEANEKGLLVVDAKGKPILTNGEPTLLEPWQIDRASAFARGMSIVTGITIEKAASSILAPGSAAFSDQYAQRIIAELAPFRHSFKFYAGSEFSRVLAYTMNRGRKPWSTKDIEDYAELSFDKKIDVLNALVPEGEERFYSILNPLEIGGIFTRTGWRIGGGGATIINDMVGGMSKDDIDKTWIGTGIQLERKRGDLVSRDKKKKKEQAAAEAAVMTQLENVGNRTPLRIFLNIRSAQSNVLDKYLERDGVDVGKLAKDKPKELYDLRLRYMERLQPILEELALLQEGANLAKHDLDDAFMTESKASDATKDLVEIIRKVWNGGERKVFFETLRDKEWKTPFTFGTDDVPYNQYSFETSGPRSVARRWGDMKSAAAASKALNELVSKGIEHFSTQEQIVEAMGKVYEGIKGYNEDDAKKFTLKLAEGIMKFYGKDYMHRLPFGIGTLLGVVTGKSSYAQVAFGRGAMAWEELQLNEFTRLLRSKGMLSEEQQHELQKRAGGGKKEVVWSYARTVVPLLALALAFHMFSKIKDEAKG